MYKRILTFSLLGATLLSACHSDGGFKKTAKGLEYKIVKDVPGDTLKLGDMVSLNFVVSIHDSVLFNSVEKNNGKPIELPVMPPQYPGEWVEGLTKLSAGDSAVFLTPVDAIRKAAAAQGGAATLPTWMKAGMKLQFAVKVVSAQSKEAAQKAAMERQAKQPAVDDSLLQAYFKSNNITPQKTASGLYYVIEKDGSGALPKKGDTVSVMYKGTMLNGKVFDTNMDPTSGHTDPLKFPVGAGQVIPGWDEGITLIKKGGKGRLFIPSSLAYGPQSPSPSMPPNSVLIFEVEVVGIK